MRLTTDVGSVCPIKLTPAFGPDLALCLFTGVTGFCADAAETVGIGVAGPASSGRQPWLTESRPRPTDAQSAGSLAPSLTMSNSSPTSE